MKKSTNSNLKKKIFEASTFVIFGYGFSQAIRLGSNLVLTRLLSPDSFGIVSIAMIFQAGLYLFTDIGIKPSIVRSSRSDEMVFLNTAWTIQIIRGAILFLATCLISYPVSVIYEEPILFKILLVIAFSSFISGFNSTSIFLLHKNMEQRTIITADIIIQSISTSTMIVVAYLTRSIWALTVSSISDGVLRLIWSHSINRKKPNRWLLNREASKELLSFGKWIMLSTGIYFLSAKIDGFLLGKYFPMALFGVYNIAIIFAELPKSIIQRLSDSVLFPTISKFPYEKIKQVLKKPRWLMLLISAVAIALFYNVADYLILFLYDERYHQAAWMLPFLVLGIWPRILVLSIDRCLLVIGKPKFIAFGNTIKLIYMLVFLPLSFHFFGVFGAIIVVTLNDIPLYLSINWGLYRSNLSLIKQDLLSTAFMLLLAAGFTMIRILIHLGVPGWEQYLLY